MLNRLQWLVWLHWLLNCTTSLNILQPLPSISTKYNGHKAVWVTSTGKEFLPRGADYIRLNGSQGIPPNAHPVYHSTFSPLLYNRTENLLALQNMRQYGYNIARVFIDRGARERTDGVGGNYSAATKANPLSQAYMDNVAEFLQQATANEIYVMLTIGQIPDNIVFHDMLNTTNNPTIQSINLLYLEKSHVSAKQFYVKSFQTELQKRLKDLISVVFAYSLENELCYVLDAPPFSLTTGTVHTADGNTYDLSSKTSRQQCADNNVINYANSVAAVVEHTQVTLGMFTYQAVDKTFTVGMQYPNSHDPRVPPRPEIVSHSKLSYLDIHVYPKSRNMHVWNFTGDIDSEGSWADIDPSKPLLMAEYGAFKEFFPKLEGIGAYMKHMMSASCKLSRPFGGWLFWTWDTWEQPRLWNMKEGQYTLAKSLSPTTFPHPCKET